MTDGRSQQDSGAVFPKDHTIKSLRAARAGGWMFSFFLAVLLAGTDVVAAVNQPLMTMKASAPGFTRFSMQASSDASGVVRQAVRAGILVIVLLLIGSIVASVVYRLIAHRWPDERSKKPLAPSQDQIPDGQPDTNHDSDHPALKPRT